MRIDQRELEGAAAVQAVQLNPNRQPDQPKLQAKQNEGQDRFVLSSMGQLRREISGMGQEAQAELQGFRADIRQDLFSGNFDPAKMAEQAPEELKDLASENGINLTQAFEELADHFEHIKSRLGGRHRHGVRGGRGRGKSPFQQNEEEEEEEEEEELEQLRIASLASNDSIKDSSLNQVVSALIPEQERD